MIFYFLGHLDFLDLLGSFLIAGSWDCSGPQVWEIGASWGDWLVFTRGLREIFPVSDFTDLRTSITTGYNHKISMNIFLKLVQTRRLVSPQVWHMRETAKSPVRSFLNKHHPTP